jgi:hypothetical protein
MVSPSCVLFFAFCICQPWEPGLVVPWGKQLLLVQQSCVYVRVRPVR